MLTHGKKMKVYKQIAQMISNNKISEDLINDFVKINMPSGAGIDSGINFNAAKSNSKKIVLDIPFHHMDENGFYDGWSDYVATVTPSFDGIDLKITGKDKNDIKYYLHDLIYEELIKESRHAPKFIDGEWMIEL